MLVSSCGCEKCDFLSSPLASPNDVPNSLLSLKRSLSSSSSCSSSRSPTQYCSRHSHHGSIDDDDVDFFKDAKNEHTASFLERLTQSKYAPCIHEALHSFCSAPVRKCRTFCLQVFCAHICQPKSKQLHSYWFASQQLIICLAIDTLIQI